MPLGNGTSEDKFLFYSSGNFVSLNPPRFSSAVTVIVRLADTQEIKFAISIANTDSYDEEKIRYRNIS